MTRIWLMIVGLVALAFGVAYLVAPRLLLDQTGFPKLPPEALTDIRATYGGLQIAVGVFLLWTSANAVRYRTGLLVVAIMFLGLAGARGAGLLIDGEWTLPMVTAFVIEAAWFVGTIIVLNRDRSVPSAVRSPR